MEGTSSSPASSSSLSSSFLRPANYVTLKDLQERWIKRKQDEAEQERLRKIMEEEEKESIRKLKAEEENKIRKGKQLAEDQPKSAPNPKCFRSPRRNRRNPAAAESSDAAARRKAGSWRASLPEESSVEGTEASEPPSARVRMPRAGFRARPSRPGADRTDEIARRVANLAVSSGGVPPTLRGGGYRGQRRGGGRRALHHASHGGGGGMVWVRKSNA